MNTLTADTLFKEKKDDFKLEVISGAETLGRRRITTGDIFRPGLALAGFTGYFLSDRIMIIGKTETSFLKTLDRPVKNRRLNRIMRFEPPCIVITKKLKIDQQLIAEACRRKIPIFRTPMSTTPFIHALSNYLDHKLAPTQFIQGTLVDVYGVGVLLIGKPGTGKSECALDLVERGHRLVCDDLVKIIRQGDLLVGSGAEKSDRLKHHLEIRGVGIIDVFRIFGVKSVRLRKRIEMVIELMLWDQARGKIERIGMERRQKGILDVSLPHIIIPLTPGKNISVIAEVVAMNYLLELRGIHVAQEYDRELKRVLNRPEIPGVYFDEDIE